MTASAIPINSHTFVGRYGGYKDWDTGLINFWHRWYDSETGRWISKDPIGVRGGINLYGYVENNVTNKYDYLGMCTKDCFSDIFLPCMARQALKPFTILVSVFTGGTPGAGNVGLIEDSARFIESEGHNYSVKRFLTMPLKSVKYRRFLEHAKVIRTFGAEFQMATILWSEWTCFFDEEWPAYQRGECK